MLIETCSIEGVRILKPKVFSDDRGYFLESYNATKFEKATGINPDFVQDNESFSTYGTLRGIHFQKPPFAQSKLVRAVTGTILDVAVDLRKGSSTFGQWHSEILSEENKVQLFVPRGFGHGFVVLSETAIFSYKVDGYYSAESDSGILWNDSSLNIDWQIDNKDVKLSDKDGLQQTFKNYSNNPCF